MQITHLNPDMLYKNPAFTQVVTVENPGRMVYVGGQNAIDAAGEIVGATLATQTEQALKNVIAALEAAHATPADVIKLQIYIVQNQDIREALAASQKIWGTRPTAITTVIVAGLSDPRYLIEIDAIAAIKR